MESRPQQESSRGQRPRETRCPRPLAPAIITAAALLCALELGAAPTAEVHVNSTAATADDYLCWSPVALTLQLNDEAAGLPELRLTSHSSFGGEVGFIRATSKPTTTQAPPSTLTVSTTGSEVTNLWVLGKRTSVAQKDVHIIVSTTSGTEIGRLPVMVRARRNAELLTAAERDRFLRALAQVHRLANGGVGSLYAKYQVAHGDGFNFGIHGGPSGIPLFLAWHRAFLIQLERELQAIDASVTIPYWRFDQPAPRIFSLEFMGRVGNLSIVEFAATNPLRGWEMFDGNGAMTRDQNADTFAPIPASRLTDLIALNNAYSGMNGAIESRYHNTAHSTIGGWLTTGTSPRDPLFFLLHANADRAWAMWQTRYRKFDDTGTDATSYHAVGTYPGTAVSPRFRKGSYARDGMWPWADNFDNASDPLDDWPSSRFTMPAGLGPPLQQPTPADVVDALDADGDGRDLAFCYDDVLPWSASMPNPPTTLTVQ